MSRAAGRSVPCDAGVRAARLAKAEEFLDVADSTSDRPSAQVALAVLAGIAAADVICCARLGEHAAGSNHSEAVALLSSADPRMSTALQLLLGMKGKAEYSPSPPSDADARRAVRAATKLLERARSL